MDIEHFKNLADGIQSIIIALGVLIGGGWALFRFRTLKDIEKAKADLEKLKRDLLERGNLKIEMQASQFDASDGSVQYISITLVITNVGNRTEIIRWSHSKIGAALIECAADGSMRLGGEIRAQVFSLYITLKASTIDPGNSEQYAALIPVEKTGTYFLESLIMGSPEETTTSLRKTRVAGIASDTYVAAWGSMMFFNVVRNPPNKLIGAAAP